MTTTRPLSLVGALLLGALADPASAQSPWTKQATVPSAGSIITVAPRSANDVWCSSSPWPYSHNGHIAHSADGGANWEITKLDIGGVSTMFWLDDQYGWTAGGAFRHTTDGGQTWITDNDWPAVADLHFLDQQHGWGCGNGGVVYYTTNGGLTWTSVKVPSGNLSSIWFTDLLHGWAVGDAWGRIMHTDDGGQTWTENAKTGLYLRTIQFVSPLEGWAVGGDDALYTTDGGQTWTPTQMPGGTWVQSARFRDMQNGVGVGESGQIVRTTDGGQTWTEVRPSGSGPRLWDVEYGDDQTIVTGGDAGALLRSTDGGSTWHQIQSGATGITRGIDVHDEGLAWASCSAGEIVRTTDGGKMWERFPVAGFGGYSGIWDIDFADDKTGWCVGRVHNGSGYDGRISRSVDGGEHWSLQLHMDFAEFLGVAAFDTQNVIAFGWGTLGDGRLLRSTNGGTSWFSAGPTEGVYRGADVLDSQTGWVAGTQIYKTTDGATNWTKQWESPTGAHLAAISMVDAQNGWAAGFQNQLLHTTDGGQTWVSQDPGAPSGTAYMGVWAVSPTTAWVTGWNQFVARTTDGGQTWVKEKIPHTAGGKNNFKAFFEACEFLDAERGWVVGDYGIYFRDPGGDCAGVTTYCTSTPNSTGAPAEIGWGGSCVAADNNFTLTASPVPNQTYLFFFGPDQTQVPFGNGFLCVTGGLTRVDPPGVASGNLASRDVDLAAFGLGAGTTMNFQCWFRDPAAGGATYNSSDGLQVTFE